MAPALRMTRSIKEKLPIFLCLFDFCSSCSYLWDRLIRVLIAIMFRGCLVVLVDVRVLVGLELRSQKSWQFFFYGGPLSIDADCGGKKGWYV